MEKFSFDEIRVRPKQRVAERVAHGGHDIPSGAIKRRFPRSLNNLFNLFSQEVDHCICCNYSAPLVFCPPACVAAMLESSHINHMLRILRFSRLAREQNLRGAE